MTVELPHEQEVVGEGVRFLPVASQRDHDRTLNHPDLWHPVRGLGVLWRHLAVPSIGLSLEALANWRKEHSERPLIVASPLAAGARFFRDHAGVPLISVATAPTSIRTLEDPMFLGDWRVPSWIPAQARRALWWALDRFKLDPMARPALVKWQRQLGTPALPERLFRDWLLSPDGVLALFPTEFCAPRPDWPTNTAQFGFPRYRLRKAPPLSAGLQTFLAAGQPPWLIYPGSAHRGSAAERQRFTQLAAVLRSQNERVILLGVGQQLRADHSADPGVFCEDWTDLPSLMPQIKAVAHHGGIGTCALAWASQTPQVILPSAYDQHENGWRMAQLGNAIELNPWPIRLLSHGNPHYHRR